VGSFHITFQVGDPEGQRWRDVDALVDTGASYTWIPRNLLEELGVVPDDKREFVIANGDIIQRDIAETQTRYGDRDVTTIVVFGDEGSLPLLGAYTLDGLSLAPDPMNQILIPVRPYAMLVATPSTTRWR
jgi:aspartyl protease family protein